MKALFSLLFLVLVLTLSLIANAQHAHHPPTHDRPSVHGMALFGKSKIYVNHLAMFHAPHNYQVIFEVEVSDPTAYETLRASTEQAGEVMTIVPEAFSLSQMIASPASFKASVYTGHFERGGTESIAEMTFKITKVVYSKKLPALPTRATQIYFGEGNEKYVAHRILHAPDVDKIVRLSDRKVIHFEEADLAD
ncbi:MAG: hypothetical protein AAB250_11125 [Bdellovibrionota bacterium]